jgi:hypothetical protein
VEAVLPETPSVDEMDRLHFHSDEAIRMDWTQFERMDPGLLLSVVNTELRDYYGNLDELCASQGVEREALCRHLAKGGFAYNATTGQFR